MFTCCNITLSQELSLIRSIHQKIEKKVPPSSSLEKCIGHVAVSALEAYTCTQFVCTGPSLCNICCVPMLVLDQEHNPLDLLSNFVLDPVLSDIKLSSVGFKKSECCRTAKVAGLTLKDYAKEKCCPIRCSLISKDVRLLV